MSAPPHTLPPSPPRPPSVAGRVLGVLLLSALVPVLPFLPPPPSTSSTVSADEDYAVAEPFTGEVEATVAVGDDLELPTRYLARIADVEVRPPAEGARVPGATLAFALELRRGEPTNLRAAGPGLTVRTDDGRGFRAGPCPPAEFLGEWRVPPGGVAAKDLCVRVPAEVVGPDLWVEVTGALADEQDALSWRLEPDLAPLR